MVGLAALSVALAAATASLADPPGDLAACDAPCTVDATCCTTVDHHASGAALAWTRRGAALFPATREHSSDELRVQLERWLADQPQRSAQPPTLIPAAPPRRHGALVVHRFAQTHRGVPVVGAGAHIVVTVGPAGAISVRGAVADPTDEYAAAQLSPAAAIAAATPQFTEQDQPAPTFGPPRLVAVVEVRALAWQLQVARGDDVLGTLLLRADTGHALAFSPHAAASPELAAAVTVRVRDFTSDLLALDGSGQVVVDASEDPVRGGPLLGSLYMPKICRDDFAASPQCGQVRLGNREIVVLDADNQPFFNTVAGHPRIVTDPAGQFLVSPPATMNEPSEHRRDAALQDYFYKLQAAYAVVDGLHAGRWDPLRLGNSTFAPATFRPRVVLADHNTVGCGSNAACTTIYYPKQTDAPQVYAEHPEADLPPYVFDPGIADPAALAEPLGYIGLNGTKDSFQTPLVVFHEFGHIVDLFTVPGLLGYGVVGGGCVGDGPCTAVCTIDSTDESDPLGETVADMLTMAFVARLYTDIPYDRCEVVNRVAGTAWAPVHHPECMLEVYEFQQFWEDRPTNPGYFANGDPTGRCDRNGGYHQAGLLQAWWEWLSAMHCASDSTACETSPDLDADKTVDAGIAAILFALSQGNANTYNQFFADMELYVACSHGPAWGDELRHAFCHHGVVDCDAPPIACPQCGDGVADPGEACDGDDLHGQTCTSLGLDAGPLRCTDDCTLDTSTCSPEPSTTSTTGDTPASTTDLPTTDAPATTTTSSTSDATTTTAAATDSVDGCTCTTTPPPLPLALLLLTLRRRRA